MQAKSDKDYTLVAPTSTDGILTILLNSVLTSPDLTHSGKRELKELTKSSQPVIFSGCSGTPITSTSASTLSKIRFHYYCFHLTTSNFSYIL